MGPTIITFLFLNLKCIYRNMYHASTTMELPKTFPVLSKTLDSKAYAFELS